MWQSPDPNISLYKSQENDQKWVAYPQSPVQVNSEWENRGIDNSHRHLPTKSSVSIGMGPVNGFTWQLWGARHPVHHGDQGPKDSSPAARCSGDIKHTERPKMYFFGWGVRDFRMIYGGELLNVARFLRFRTPFGPLISPLFFNMPSGLTHQFIQFIKYGRVYCKNTLICKWWFPEIGVPPVIILFNGIVPNKNHPAIGVPPMTMDTPIFQPLVT